MAAHKNIYGTTDWDWVCDQVEAGRYMTNIAEELGVSTRGLRLAIQKDPELYDRVEAAKVASAEALLQSAEAILAEHEAVRSSAHASIAKERAGFKRWLAGCRDRDSYGDRPAQVNVGIDLGLGDLHLEALRQAGHMTPERRMPRTVEAEVIEEGGGLPKKRLSASERRVTPED